MAWPKGQKRVKEVKLKGTAISDSYINENKQAEDPAIVLRKAMKAFTGNETMSDFLLISETSTGVLKTYDVPVARLVKIFEIILKQETEPVSLAIREAYKNTVNESGIKRNAITKLLQIINDLL